MIRGDVILDLVIDICENEKLQLTLKGAAKGGFFVGLFCMISSLFLGPIGFILGGIFGGMYTYRRGPKFKPLQDVIRYDLTTEEKDTIVYKVREVVEGLGPEDAVKLLLLVKNTPALKAKVVGTIMDTVSSRA